jgi:hypothetical protein
MVWIFVFPQLDDVYRINLCSLYNILFRFLVDNMIGVDGHFGFPLIMASMNIHRSS